MISAAMRNVLLENPDKPKQRLRKRRQKKPVSS
jgi:hypothetical protein